MANTIALRVYDFLKTYPPFDLLEAEELQRIAARVVVQYRRAGELLYRQGERPGAYFFVLREGAVRLMREEREASALVDRCDEGDVFGLRPLLAGEVYQLTAQAEEESLIYALPVEDWRPLLDRHPRVAAYLAGALAADGRSGIGARRAVVAAESAAARSFELVEIQPVEARRAPVTCPPDRSIAEAAAMMSREAVGSVVVVDARQRPIGIVTDKDLRRRVATGAVPVTAPVAEIMSRPVRTMAPGLAIADVQMAMLRHGVHHLVLTADGSDRTAVVGVLSEHDILVVQGNNPAILLREVGRSGDGAALRRLRDRAEALLAKYLAQEVSISFIASVMTELNDALICRAVELSQQALRESDPGIPFCWLSIGSAGREEQLLRTDQDSALVFADPDAAAYEKAKDYFLALARRSTALLHECGYAYCPAEMMASNPRWCLSLTEWKTQFGRWITEPTPEAVMHSTIFFDYRPVFGRRELASQLTAFLFEQLDAQSVFLSHLAKNALQNPPPLTFFRHFVVEKGGEHQSAFDIKARALMPLADAARVLALGARLPDVTNTFRRFEQLAEREPKNRELLEQAAEAYEVLLRFRTTQGLKQGDSGRYFKPSELSKMERLYLRNSFRAIRDVQALLSTRFRTVYFS